MLLINIMKQTLVEATEKVPNSCEGCVFFIKADVCYPPICQRLFNKDKDCQGKIYIFSEPEKEKKTRKKKSSK